MMLWAYVLHVFWFSDTNSSFFFSGTEEKIRFIISGARTVDQGEELWLSSAARVLALIPAYM